MILRSRMPMLQRGVSIMAETVKEQKKALRSTVKRALRSIPVDLRREEEKEIQSHVLSADWFKRSGALCAYLSCPALLEVDTSRIVTEILQPRESGVCFRDSERAKTLYVPRLMDREANMSMLHISSFLDLTANSMGIIEPEFKYPDGNPRKTVMDSEEPVDLLLLPGLAFDRTGRRLGRGGGYYDKFLQKYLQLVQAQGWKAPLLVALAFSVQVLENPLPVDKTDIPVDALVLESGVLAISDYGRQNLLNQQCKERT